MTQLVFCNISVTLGVVYPCSPCGRTEASATPSFILEAAALSRRTVEMISLGSSKRPRALTKGLARWGHLPPRVLCVQNVLGVCILERNALCMLAGLPCTPYSGLLFPSNSVCAFLVSSSTSSSRARGTPCTPASCYPHHRRITIVLKALTMFQALCQALPMK